MFLLLLTIILSSSQSFAHSNINQHNIQKYYPTSHNNSNTAVERRDNYQGVSSYGWPSHTEHHHESNAPSHGGHGSSLHSYFDIALTALAFLSFGIFLLNLLLNALLFSGLVTATGTGTGNTGDIITETQTSTGTQTGTQTGTVRGRDTGPEGLIREYNTTSLVNDDESRHRANRGRRATLELFLDPVSSMDSLAHTVLKSIDAMMEKHECVGKVFCEGNRQAKIIGSGFQYLMPLYSMSASYFGKKFGWHENILDHLTAVLLGQIDSNCQNHFPQC